MNGIEDIHSDAAWMNYPDYILYINAISSFQLIIIIMEMYI